MAKDRNKAELDTLTALFRDNEAVYCSPSYDEANARVDFIDKLFELLGWDVRNLQGYSEDYRDVVREDKVVIAGKPKAPDYSFRVGGSRVFFVEAKKPQVHIKDAAEPAFQVRRYAYTAKLPLSILTNFREFAVYDTRIKPVSGDAPSVARVFYCGYADYAAKWEYLESTFSKAAVLKGSFARYVAENKGKKGSSDIDKEFLGLISLWREELAKNLALRNKDLDLAQLNYAVQKLIDRMIFLRIAEDRGTEDYESLRKAAVASEAYWKLGSIFAAANQKYNSDLFKIDDWLSKLAVDDGVLKSIAASMYYPECPYEFSVMPIETLGNIYEQFLGQTIRLTEGHRAKIEEKPEVRKAGGVFYTPQYIVDYIVRGTIGPLVEGRKPEDVAKIKVLDPACGSGSFLIGAYSFLLDYCLRWYAAEENIKKALKSGAIYQYGEKHYHLSIGEKQRILLGCIHGVDIDPQAVEVTKLSLLLKLMEHEETESSGELFRHSDFRFLPNLSGNIKCGNSLIDRKQLYEHNMFGDAAINPFDWNEFPFPCFDAVIGNPPYIRIQEMQAWAPAAAELYKLIYQAGGARNFDIYVLFIEKALSLIGEEGRVGFILPNKFMQQEYGEEIRRKLGAGNHVSRIVNFKDFQVFKGATTYTCLLFLSKDANDSFEYSECSSEELPQEFSRIDSARLDEKPWAIHGERELAFMDRLARMPRLGELCDNIFVGIQTSADKVFILEYVSETAKTYTLHSESLGLDVKLEKKYLRHIISGVDVKKYRQPPRRQFVIFPYEISEGRPVLVDKKLLKVEYPLMWEYLSENKKILEGRENGKMKGESWYGYVYLKNMALQNARKICVPRLVKSIQAIHDAEGQWCLDNVDVGGVILKPEYASLTGYLLGLLNSKLLSFYLSKISTPFRGGFWSCNRQYLEQLPVVIPDEGNADQQALAGKIGASVSEITRLRVQSDERSEKDADFLEEQIDKLVYRLYSLGPEEIALVEGAE